jgi:hypothetical protein
MEEFTRYVSSIPGVRPVPGQVFGDHMIERIEIGARLREADGTMLVWDGESWVRPRTRGRIKPPQKRQVRQLSTPAEEA